MDPSPGTDLPSGLPMTDALRPRWWEVRRDVAAEVTQLQAYVDYLHPWLCALAQVTPIGTVPLTREAFRRADPPTP